MFHQYFQRLSLIGFASFTFIFTNVSIVTNIADTVNTKALITLQLCSVQELQYQNIRLPALPYHFYRFFFNWA